MNNIGYTRKYFILASATVFFLSPANAYAKDNHHNDRIRYYESENRRHDREADVIVIEPHDRIVIHNYMERNNDRFCPPGLAKKRNGCLPPGHAKRYRVGYVLPRTVKVIPVYYEEIGLQPPPRGYYYGQVDTDVLLLSEATRKVIDAIELYSAVGH